MHCSQDYLCLHLLRIEKLFRFSHLCSIGLLSLPVLQVRSPGDLIRRWAPRCGHRAQQPGRAQLQAPPLPVISSWRLAFPLGWTLPCPRLPATVSSGWRGPEKHTLPQGDKLSSRQAFLAGPATASVVRFQRHWMCQSALCPKHTSLPTLPWGLNCHHYRSTPWLKDYPPLKSTVFSEK